MWKRRIEQAEVQVRELRQQVEQQQQLIQQQQQQLIGTATALFVATQQLALQQQQQQQRHAEHREEYLGDYRRLRLQIIDLENRRCSRSRSPRSSRDRGSNHS
eukprot:4260063-Karenia_brevis.AAC.1